MRIAMVFRLFLLFSGLLFPIHGGAAAVPPEPRPTEIRLSQHVVHDRNANMKAMVAVTPSDWSFRGQAVWDGQSIAYPARVSFQADGPADGAQVSYFPMENFTYVTGQPVGQRMNGFISLPAMNAEQYLRALFRNIRPQADNVKITINRPDWLVTMMQQNVPTAQQDISRSGMQGQASADVAEMSVSYSESGQRWEERLYTGILYTNVVLPTGMRPTYTGWTTTGVVSKRVHAGKYQAHQAAFEIIEKNATVDPEWFTAVAIVGQKLIQRQMYELKRNWRAAQDMVAAKRQITEDMLQSFREREASNDRISRMRSDAILGIDRYESSEARLALPSGYKHAWEKKNGDIIMTDSPLLNPNEGDPGQWNKIPKAR